MLGHAALLGAVVASLGPGAVPAPTPAGATSTEVRVPLSAEALARVEQARLTGAARAHAEAERAEALDLARAAVLAGEVAATIAQVTVPEADATLLDDLRAAQWELESAPRAAAAGAELEPVAFDDVTPTAANGPAGDAPPADDDGPGPAEDPAAEDPAATTEVPGDADVPGAAPPEETEARDGAEVLDEAAALEAAAQRVFALSLEIEAGRQAVVDEQRLRAQHVTELEQAVETAAALPAPVAPEEATPAPAGALGPVAGPLSGATDDPWPNGRIPTAALCAPQIAPGALLRCDAAEALDELSAAYRAEHGTDLVVTSGYRSYDQQAQVKRARGWLAAPPGRSNHGRGIAVDLAGMGGLGQFDTPAYQWMRRHAPTFGWFHPRAMQPGGSGPPEPWHWEFAGTAADD